MQSQNPGNQYVSRSRVEVNANQDYLYVNSIVNILFPVWSCLKIQVSRLLIVLILHTHRMEETTGISEKPAAVELERGSDAEDDDENEESLLPGEVPDKVPDELKEKYRTLTISGSELEQLAELDLEWDYILTAVRDKFSKPKLGFSCLHCAKNALYDGGVVSEEELAEAYYSDYK